MEMIFQVVILPLVALAIGGFLGSAVVKPDVFVYLFKPAMIFYMALIVVGTSFYAGANVALFAAQDTLREAMPKDCKFNTSLFPVAGIVFNYFAYFVGSISALGVLTLAVAPLADRMLAEERKKQNSETKKS